MLDLKGFLTRFARTSSETDICTPASFVERLPDGARAETYGLTAPARSACPAVTVPASLHRRLDIEPPERIGHVRQKHFTTILERLRF